MAMVNPVAIHTMLITRGSPSPQKTLCTLAADQVTSLLQAEQSARDP